MLNCMFFWWVFYFIFVLVWNVFVSIDLIEIIKGGGMFIRFFMIYWVRGWRNFKVIYSLVSFVES